MIRDIIHYPNKKLKQISKKVELFDDALHTLLDDMYETMIARNGIGLAAIQIGVALDMLVIELYDEDGNKLSDRIEAINPVITQKEGETKYREGCLSVPDYYEEVSRSEQIDVTYQNRYGETQNVHAEGLLAIVFQHEIDHLRGKLFIERLSILKRKKFEKEFKNRAKDSKK